MNAEHKPWTFELNPCPFCGGKAQMETIIRDSCYPVLQIAYIMCCDCRASSNRYADSNMDGQHIFKAIEAWNRRQ